MDGRNLPPHPTWDRVNVFENLGKAAALPALPLITYAPDVVWPLFDDCIFHIGLNFANLKCQVVEMCTQDEANIK